MQGHAFSAGLFRPGRREKTNRPTPQQLRSITHARKGTAIATCAVDSGRLLLIDQSGSVERPRECVAVSCRRS
jgi:hypothetical protein